ncbi:MAG: hypothetical protein IPN49_08210 [Saprospiraceae bacterium]|nr:hypothetical protein [Saprospiraceae bacterium]
MSITGKWGSGKSSFLNLIKRYGFEKWTLYNSKLQSLGFQRRENYWAGLLKTISRDC